jgi:hypothetical protein
MRIHLLAVLLFCTGIFTKSFAQCGPNERTVRLEIDPDQYFEEVHFEISAQSGEVLYTGQLNADSLHIFTYCVPDSQCTVFKITDVYGDGIFPDGFYRLYSNNVLVKENLNGNYAFGETTRFGCPPGYYCDNPFLIDTLGVYNNPHADETWYSYTPKDTGTYIISTCDLGNNCPSKIWVYDRCQGITVAENQTGAIFYSNTGCDNGATATLYLAGTKTYFIRMKYTQGTCNNVPLNFSIAYAGPVKGCLDPTACNYNPLATISDTCIYNGSADCHNNPDLVVIEQELRNTLHLDFIANADACMVLEGCLRGTGNRYIIRFTTHIQNQGVQDYFIGETPADPTVPSNQFVWDPCHNHWHYRGYADYLLYDSNGNSVPIGSKNGFCVLDLECSNGGAAQYSCQNMGITAGCGDIYDSSLPCQWIDITELAAGTYTLVVRVNWDQSPDKLGRIESDYKNNWGQVCFQLGFSGLFPTVDILDNDCPPVVDCAGVPLGDSRLDCAGVCGGTAIAGDFNQDSVRNSADVVSYMEASIAENQTVTNCSDLFSDGKIDVYDAALLQECDIHQNDANHWGVRFACQFPTGLQNDKEVVYLLPGTLDETAKTFDVQVVNPYSKLIGYEFSISGLTIDSVVSLSPNFDGIQYFTSKGKIAALSPTETTVKKNILPAGLVRIYYSGAPAHNVCITSVEAIVNDKYQRDLGLVSDQNCVNSSTVGTQNQFASVNSLFIQPNPFQESTQIFFSNPDAEQLSITLSDMTGRVVRSFQQIREESITITRGNLAAGMYMVTVRGKEGVRTGVVICN